MNRHAGWSLVLMALLAAQACAPKKAEVPALAYDPKDFGGTWDRYPQPTENSGQDPSVVPRPEPIPAPPLKPEFKAPWDAEQKKIAAANAAGEPIATGYTHCIPDGMPAMMMGMFPMEIFQRKDQINITQEAFSQTRRIYMNQKLPKWDEVDPGFYGTAVGRWEGDTLVIETTGIKQNVTFRWTPHSEAMRITERIRLIAPDILQDQITVEDDYLEKPWTYTYSFRRMKGYKLQEYVCEDNREYVGEDGKVHLRIDK